MAKFPKTDFTLKPAMKRPLLDRGKFDLVKEREKVKRTQSKTNERGSK